MCDQAQKGSLIPMRAIKVQNRILYSCLTAVSILTGATVSPVGLPHAFAQASAGAGTAGATQAVNRPVRDKWALIVGISDYQNKDIPRLKYASKDARDFRDYLVNEANFAPDHVRLLLNEQATQRRVLSELGTKFLARVAKPDDMVVLFFSSHGSPAQADIRGQNFIVASDTDPEDLYTTGIEMDKVVDSIKSRILSDRVLLVLDACHSGAVRTNSKGLYYKGNFDAEQLAQGTGQLVICSSEPNQQSWESKRYENGI
ncbi:MAG: caspase family protein, partial [Cyanobacteria bacterium]|nr:caspase family protein [Cyanobacteriota bacterium]